MKILFCFVLLLLLLDCTKKDETPIDNIPKTVTVADFEGNIYKTVTIGTQVWMEENLKTTKYNDGTSIQFVTDNTVWAALKTPAYCWYDNNGGNYKDIYGAIYNWYAVNTGKLCPYGWHVPSDDEWTTLITFLGGESVAGNKLKETGTVHWNSPNNGATNMSGFTALPGGVRSNFGGTFYFLGQAGDWWSSTLQITSQAWHRSLAGSTSSISRDGLYLSFGVSVRCIKD